MKIPKDFDSLMKNIDLNRIFLGVIPALANNTLVIAGVWFLLSKYSTTINRLNTPIAMAEFVPTLDLNLPAGVTLGAMIDKSEDTILAYNFLKRGALDIDLPDAPTKEDVEKLFKPLTEEATDFINWLTGK